MPRFVRRLGRRPSFSLMLVVLVVALTGLTGATIGGLAWLEQRARSRVIVDAAMAQAARLASANTARFLRAAESAAALGTELVDHHQLDPDDDLALERFVLAVLDTHPDFTWASYGGRDDRFVGARRDAVGDVFVNRSFPMADGRIRLEEDRVLPGDVRVPFRRSSDHGYRPRERPYFRAAEARRGVAWTEPYDFFAGGGLGITCASPVLDRAGRVLGVFTVDFSLGRLAGFLEAVQVSPNGRVFLATREGRLIAAQRRDAVTSVAEDALLRPIADRIGDEAESAFELEHAGERYLGRAVSMPVGGLGWLAEVVVPEADYTEQVDAEARRTLVLGLAALGLALTAGVATARWIARPLRELAALARRVRRGQLDVPAVPRSRDEIGVLARAIADMVQALRDRDFVRDALGRYVSPELAERCLRDPGALSLGGEARDVVILMSDLREFTELSERLGPETMIDLLNRYLSRMTSVILAHGGMINEFIGDAILVLFGAPFGRPDDADRAVRCAWAMQEAMTELNEANRQLGLPELAMGIGLHRGRVVTGNIGGRDRVKYGVVGPPVNLAARIQAVSRGGEILLTDAVVSHAAGVAHLGPARSLRLKGTAAPVTLYPMLALVKGDGVESRHPEVLALS
jgi:adenylate cyclase